MSATVECPIYRFTFNITEGKLFYKQDNKTKRGLVIKLHFDKANLKSQMKENSPVFMGEFEKKELVAMYLSGEDITTISSYFCVNESTIRNWADKIPIPTNAVQSPYIREKFLNIKMWRGLEKLDFPEYALRWALNSYNSQLVYKYKLQDGESVTHELSDIHHITVRRCNGR